MIMQNQDDASQKYPYAQVRNWLNICFYPEVVPWAILQNIHNWLE